jgi:hypothetical protein
MAGISGQPLSQECPQDPQSLCAASPPPRYGLYRAIEIPTLRDLEVTGQGTHGTRFPPSDLCPRIAWCDEEARQMLLQSASQDERRILFFREKVRLDNHISIACPERNPPLFRYDLSPAFGFANRVLVPNN